MKYKIWLIMLNICNEKKISYVENEGNEERVYFKYKDYCKDFLLEEAVKIEEYMLHNNIGLITVNDNEYPEPLKVILERPYGLFYKGNISLLKGNIVGIVGSRMCTSYGGEITKLLTKELISYNITIISGGAKGIDTFAHKTTLEQGGKTIIVLGCGVDVIYPRQNSSLFKMVEKEGLIISEFLPKTPPLPYHFPLRNRIISGLSKMVIVTEASSKSGSLITATYAADMGKTVMAVPGSVFSKGSNGCNRLIRDGAQMFTGIEDLHSILGLDFKGSLCKITSVEKKLLSVIESEPLHIDEILQKSHIDRATLFKVLFEMQIKKEIISLPGNYYAKIT